MQLKKIKKLLLTNVIVLATVSSLNIYPSAVPNNTELETNQSQLTEMQEELKNTMNDLDKTEQDLITIGKKITTNKETLEKAEKKQKKQYEDTKSIIKFLYETNTSDFKIEKILESNSIATLNSNLEYMTNVQEYSIDKLKEYEETAEQIKNLQIELKNDEEELKIKEDNLRKKEDELEKEIEDKKIQIEDIEKINETTITNTSNEENVINSTQTAKHYNIKDGELTDTQKKILEAGFTQLGVPYVWGGTTPRLFNKKGNIIRNGGLDCSGFTQFCYRKAGITIPRTSGPQGRGTRVSEPQFGDIYAYPGHVTICLRTAGELCEVLDEKNPENKEIIKLIKKKFNKNDRIMMAAPHTGDVVKIQKVYGSPWCVRWW